MSNWSELPHDLLVEIVEHIEKLDDFVAFGAVCKGWSKARKKEHFKGRLWLRQDTPYLMLPVRSQKDDTSEFYSLVEDKIVESVRIPKFKARKCFESLGWLLAIEDDGSMCLLDPFSSVEIPVPHQREYKYYYDSEDEEMDGYVFVDKMVLSARPSETSDFILMIISGDRSCLAFWRLGDESWDVIDIEDKYYKDVMYHDGHFYATNYIGHRDEGSVWIFTFEEGYNSPVYIERMVCHLVNNNHVHDKLIAYTKYILKTSQSLFIIIRYADKCSDDNEMYYYRTKKFQVYEADMSKGIWAEIDSIGSMAIFVGHNATFAVDSSRFSGKIKGNHIYFTHHDNWETYHFDEKVIGGGKGKDMGAYNMETKTVESFYSGEVLLSKVSPSIWITPSF